MTGPGQRLLAICSSLLCVLAASVSPALPQQDDAQPDEPPHPCKLLYTEPPKAIDRVRGFVHRTVCSTALWFDELFGDSRSFEHEDRSHGVLELGSIWEEGGQADAVGQARIHWRFPAMRQRLRIVAGRLPEERIVAQQEDVDGLAEDLDEREQEVVLGAESQAFDRDSYRIRFGAGLSYKDSMESYVNMPMNARWPLTRRTDLRIQATPYWQDGDRGLGLRSIFDLDTQLRPELLMRWTAAGTNDGLTDGARYNAGPSLFHRLNATWSMAHRIAVAGESGTAVRVRSYGYVNSVRRSVLREWLFVEISAGVDWRRRRITDAREPVGRVGIALEMHFG